QGLADDLAGETGQPGPVGAELKLQRNARYHAHGEIDPEDARPEAGHLVVALVLRTQGHHLEDHHEQGQPHGQLRKQVMIGDREGELDAVPEQCIRHRVSSTTARAGKASLLTPEPDQPSARRFSSMNRTWWGMWAVIRCSRLSSVSEPSREWLPRRSKSSGLSAR